MSRMWSIALYIRLSREDGRAESASVTHQKEILLEYLAREFQGEYALAGVYADDGATGTDYDRPAFGRLLQDMEQGLINCVLCKNLSRAFRNYADQGYFLEHFFPSRGIRFITLGDPKIDTYLQPEAVTGLEVPISGLMNDRFAYKTSSDIRRTLDTKRRKGAFIGAFAPYGYQKNPQNKNMLLIDEEAAAVVRDIFQWFVYGADCAGEAMSKAGIARRLSALGIPNPTRYKREKGLRYENPGAGEGDGLWSSASVSGILKNKVYIGTMVQGRQRVISYKIHHAVKVPEEGWYQVEDTHAPIVSKALFQRAQEKQGQAVRRAPRKGEHYLFSGLLRCADCKGGMTRRKAGGHVYYNCTGYQRKGTCSRHTIRLDILEGQVLGALQEQIAALWNLEEIQGAIRGTPISGAGGIALHKLQRRQEREKAKKQRLLAELYADWKSGEVSREQYRSMAEQFSRQAYALEESLQRIQMELDSGEEGAGEGNSCLQEFLREGTISSLHQGLLSMLVEVIYIHEGGGLTIAFRFAKPG